MIDIEQLIEQFDEYIDTTYENMLILGKQYVVSEWLKDYDHKHYCAQLDKYIKDNFSIVTYENETFYERDK